MKYLEILQAVEKESRENYNLASGEIEQLGQSANKNSIILKYNDNGIEISIKYKTKDALKAVYGSRVAKGEFKNCTFDEFVDMFNRGYDVKDIEPELQKNKLDFGDGKQEE